MPSPKKKNYRWSNNKKPNKKSQKATATLDIATIKRNLGPARLERIRKQAIRDAWTAHRDAEQALVQQLPTYITSQFGQLGYGRYGNRWLPILAICPFDVGLEWIREDWHKHFRKVGEPLWQNKVHVPFARIPRVLISVIPFLSGPRRWRERSPSILIWRAG